jgi:hypothetical protein
VKGGPKPRLAVVVDGVPMEEEAARETWRRFSDHMEANKGDLAGFAKLLGYASAQPTSSGGQAVLVLSKTAPQVAYGTPQEQGKKGRR